MLLEGIYAHIKTNWRDYENIFDGLKGDEEITPENFRSSMKVNKFVSTYHDYAKQHAEETFCDFMGVRLFHESYFYAFAYLCSPGTRDNASIRYPKISIRVKNLVRASRFFEIDTFAPRYYERNFDDNLDTANDNKTSLSLMFQAVEAALESTVEFLLEKVREIAETAQMPSRSEEDVRKCAASFKSVVPARDIKFLSDIISAGWVVYNDQELWIDKPELIKQKESVLFDLVLKSIEVFEIEAILRAHS